MEQLNFITNRLGMTDKNIIILDYLDAGTHKEVIAKLDYPASKCHNCQGQMAKYDFQKESKIPYLECAGYKTLIRKTNLNHLPEHLSWDEYSFKKGKMSFIAQDYDTRKILAILDGRTQQLFAIISFGILDR